MSDKRTNRCLEWIRKLFSKGKSKGEPDISAIFNNYIGLIFALVALIISWFSMQYMLNIAENTKQLESVTMITEFNEFCDYLKLSEFPEDITALIKNHNIEYVNSGLTTQDGAPYSPLIDNTPLKVFIHDKIDDYSDKDRDHITEFLETLVEGIGNIKKLHSFIVEYDLDKEKLEFVYKKDVQDFSEVFMLFIYNIFNKDQETLERFLNGDEKIHKLGDWSKPMFDLIDSYKYFNDFKDLSEPFPHLLVKWQEVK